MKNNQYINVSILYPPPKGSGLKIDCELNIPQIILKKKQIIQVTKTTISKNQTIK